MTRLVVAVLSLALASAGCKHHASFTTEPPGASVESMDLTVRDQTIEARSGFAESHLVRVNAPGYQSRDFVIQKSYRADLSLVLLLLGIVPYFFTARIEDSYHFKLQPVPGPGPGPVGPPPGPALER